MSSFLDKLVVAKVGINRMGTYLQILNFSMIGYVFIKSSGISPWWLCLVVPLLLAGAWFDLKYVHQREIDYSFRKSQVLEGIKMPPGNWSKDFVDNFNKYKPGESYHE